jgi:hypothetical protein
VRKLPNHLATRTVLNQQCVFAVDLIASRDVSHFDQQRGTVDADWRDTAFNGPIICMDFGRCKVYLVRVLVPGSRDATQDLSHLRLVIHELQQRLPSRAFAADAKHVFGSRIEVGNEEIVIQQDDA